MAKFYMAKIDNITFRLRVEIGDEMCHILFMYFENTYKILTYGFLSAQANHVLKTAGGWQEVKAEKAQPILELGMQEWTALMQNVQKTTQDSLNA